MTTTLQVEQRLLALGGATFQRLCDAYLRRCGFDSLLSIGLTVGKQATRIGTPDSLAPDGSAYTLFEVTTEKKGIASKLKGDIKKCLDPSKIGMPLSRIRRVCLCYTGRLKATDVEQLYDLVRSHGVSLELYDIPRIADDIRHNHQILAREYLDIEIDSGQVLDLSDFVRYQAGMRVQTDLDAAFVGRVEELERLVRHLASPAPGQVVLLSGPAGVGKTRLALEAAQRSALTVASTKIRVVRTRGRDASSDLLASLERPGRYLIVLDDANRLENLAGLLDILMQHRPNHDVRVLLTVRDYVSEEVRALLWDRGDIEEIRVTPLSDEQIRTLVVDSFEIRNYHYQDRILQIAAGNARLAVMAARIAVETNDLTELHDATEVYARFYGSLRRECPILTTTEGLRSIASVALVGRLSLEHEQLSSALGRVHGLPDNVFLAMLQGLDDVELVDLYDQTVVRVSDQTLTAYVLFLALVERRVLSMRQAILELYPRVRGSLVEAIGSLVRAFRGEDVRVQLYEAVNHVWEHVGAEWPSDTFDAFVLDFSGIRGADALAHAVRRLEARPPAVRPPEWFAPTAISTQETVTDPIVRILGEFRRSDPLRSIALRAIVAEARRSLRPAVLTRLAWEKYGFAPDSHWNDLEPENALSDTFWAEAAGDHEIAAPMFLAVAREALRTEQSAFASGRSRSVVITRFQVPDTKAVRAFRDGTLRRIAALWEVQASRPAILELLRAYANGGLEGREVKLIHGDLTTLEPLLLPLLDVRNYAHVSLVRGLRQMRRRLGLGVPRCFAPFLSSQLARVAELLLKDPTEVSELGWKAADAKRRARLRAFGACMDKARLNEFVTELGVVLAEHSGHDEYLIREGAVTVLAAAGVALPNEVEALVRRWIATENPLDLYTPPILNGLISILGGTRVRDLVTTGGPSPGRDPWVVGWLQLLPRAEWTLEGASLAVDILRDGDASVVAQARGLLEPICLVSADLGHVLLRDLVTRMTTESHIADILSFEFYDESLLLSPVGAVLKADPKLFGDLYLALEDSTRDVDPHAEILSELLTLIPEFGPRWLEHRLARFQRTAREGHREYASIWRRHDWGVAVGALCDFLLATDTGEYFGDTFLRALLRLTERTTDAGDLAKRQDELLASLVKQTANDEPRRRRLFYAIGHLPIERRKGLIAEYLSLDPPLEDFAELTIEPTSYGWSGSEVPLLERRRDFLTSLLPICDRPALMQHLQLLEGRIRGLGEGIRRAHRTDFVEAT